MKLCMNLCTLAHVDLKAQLRACAAVGFTAVGLRLNKLEEYFAQGKNIGETRHLLESLKLFPLELNYFPDWIYANGVTQKEVIDRFRRFSHLSARLGCPLLILPTQCDGEHDDALAGENLLEMCRLPAETGTRVAFEFVPWSPIDTMKKAWDLLTAVDHPNGGLVLDSFHYFKGGSRFTDLKEVPIERILIVQMADALNDPRLQAEGLSS